MVVFKSLVLLLLVVLSVCQLSAAAPQPREEEDAALSPGEETAVEHNDAEVLERDRRAFACTDSGAFGGTSAAYTEFRDISIECGCGADITYININYNNYIGGIQTSIRYTDGTNENFPFHGIFSLSSRIYLNPAIGERIIGVTGFVNTFYVRQLTFIAQTQGGALTVYGPYGEVSGITSSDRYFSVVGKINTIYGSYDNYYLRAIGFYYESEGTHNIQP